MINSFRGKYTWLSNFEEASIVYEDIIFQANEHAFQAAKTHNVHAFNLVLDAKTPGQAKRLGKTVPLRADWEDIKLKVMYDINMCKFTQHPELKQKLIDTGNEELIEGNNYYDSYWGICNGVGHNHLGKILMKIREELKWNG